MSVPIKLVTIKSNGKRYIYLSEHNNKVHVKGEVLDVAGFDARYGKDKTFLRDRVDIYECDLTEELLQELKSQDAIPLLT